MLGFMMNCGFGDTKAPSWFIWDRLSKKTKPVSLRNTDPSVSCAVLFIPSAVGQESFHLSIWLFFSCSILSDFLRFHGLQHAKLPCLSPSPRTCSNSCPLSQWCHSTTSSSVVHFFSCFHSPSIRFFPNELALCIRWPKYWSFNTASYQWILRANFL